MHTISYHIIHNLLRFWHPELTPVEIDAFKYIFGCLDHANIGEEALELFEMKYLLMGKVCIQL